MTMDDRPGNGIDGGDDLDLQIGDADLNAYVDGELDGERRIEVELYLAANPAVAARVHDYLLQRESLRQGMELLAGRTPASLEGLSGRLCDRLQRDRGLRRLGPLAAAVLLAVGGWTAASWLQGGHHRAASAAVPGFAGEAAEAHSTAMALNSLQSSVSPADHKAMADVLARRIGGMTVDLPAVDAGLTLVRATVVPWSDGPALQFVYREPDGEWLTLFVAGGSPAEDSGLHSVEQDGLLLVYWRSGSLAYTVTGSKTDGDLLAVARRMADSIRRS